MRLIAPGVVGLLLVGSHLRAQELSPDAIAAIELAAAEYTAKSRPLAGAAFDGYMYSPNIGVSRDSAHVARLALALNARNVWTDSVLICGEAVRCTLMAAALVRMGAPVSSPEGARVTVETFFPSSSARRGVGRGSVELLLARENGRWRVVGKGTMSAT